MAEAIRELVKVLPDNDWLRFALIVIIVLLIVLREKLFIGLLSASRYMYRWWRCQFFEDILGAAVLGGLTTIWLLGYFSIAAWFVERLLRGREQCRNSKPAYTV